MKKLTKKKRNEVRLLIKRAMNDLKVAKDITFKAYGSHSFSEYISSALYVLGRSFEGLSKTKPPKETPIQKTIETTDECPAKGIECKVKNQETEKWVDEKDIENRFKSVVCEDVRCNYDQFDKGMRFKEDLEYDELDTLELFADIEEEFGIIIPDEAIDTISTCGDLLNLVKSKVLDK